MNFFLKEHSKYSLEKRTINLILKNKKHLKCLHWRSTYHNSPPSSELTTCRNGEKLDKWNMIEN